MTPLAENITLIFSLLTIGANLISLILLVAIFSKKNNFSKKIINFTGSNTLLLAFLATLGASLGSIAYSEIIGFSPCKLCWIQRIFLFPQPIILGLAFLKKDFKITDYIIALSVVGSLVALYHSYTLFGGTSLLECTGEGGECSVLYFQTFGYVTLPTMALSIFILSGIIMWVRRVYEKIQ